jgi:myo-inositol 2-dehydrogenase / D-chiro-inositol 1-dehydrogenase
VRERTLTPMRSVPPDQPVRYGVIGTGMMGVEHIHNIAAVAGAEVVALCDPHRPSVDRALGALKGAAPMIFDDHRALLAADICDAVVIATPNMSHASLLHDVFEHDVHVLIEKPLCTTVGDCRRVTERAVGLDNVVWMGLEYRYMPPIAELLRHVRADAVGDVRMVAIREHRFPFLRKVDNWNRFSRNTGGTLVEKCCHFFDLMNLIIGQRPTRVYASGAQDVNHLDERYDGETPDILDNAFVIVDYDGGGRAMLDLCMFAEASKNEQEISVVGSTGKLEALIPESVVRHGRRADGVGAFDEVPVQNDTVTYAGFHHGSSYLEHLDFVAAIRNGTPPLVTVEEGLWSVAVGAAAHRSIDETRPVEVAEMFDEAVS